MLYSIAVKVDKPMNNASIEYPPFIKLILQIFTQEHYTGDFKVDHLTYPIN